MSFMSANRFPQRSHGKFLTPRWTVTRCLFRSNLRLNFFPQSGQGHSGNSVCTILTCTVYSQPVKCGERFKISSNRGTYMKIQTSDWLVTKGTDSPNTQMYSFSVERIQIIHWWISQFQLQLSTFHKLFSSLLPVAVNCPLVVKWSEAVRALKELALGPAQVVRLDVHCAGVLVLELPFAYRAGHGQVLEF